MGFLLHDGKLRMMEKKLTNSGSFTESTSKHNIYPLYAEFLLHFEMQELLTAFEG